ncbi:uncharacterized protein LOC132729625 [Ruditapes philippinarum]|uniref:uncharacterized protein LOC132729625 n=1 Tax=Ruditapes philippinarum TaxID=129788 RepID=UPI00295AF66D|nr:uncharacterized protein LOC132729625 [Ruditapes philippinarum]
MELSCKNLSIFQKSERILQDIELSVNGGEILAVIGHEACGKTALLSVLSGRYPLYEGTICFNGVEQKYDALSKQVAFVTSHPLFLPTLTIRETVEYAGYLRLDKDISRSEKLDQIKTAQTITGLTDCATLPAQLCSKLQQVCLGIACELLQCTGVLVIDEPLSGMSCNDCYKMTDILTKICQQTNKAIIVSLSSPLNYFINRCSKVLFVNQGQAIYQGNPAMLEAFLRAAGCPTSLHDSPAEHLMSILGSGINHTTSIQNSLLTRIRKNGTYISAHDDIWVPNGLLGNEHDHDVDKIRETDLLCDSLNDQDQMKVNLEKQTFSLQMEKMTLEDATSSCRTSFWNQMKVLTSRNFYNSRRRILFPVSVIQNLYILVICVLIWWQPERTEETIKDRMGLFFFTVVQWAFFALLDAILTFPKEMRVILSEMQNKLYRTSAYCLSKTISEIPLAIIQPCVYMIVIYWVANLNSVSAFLASLGVLIVDVVTAQSIGLFVGAALNPPWTISVVSLGLLSMMLWGGAFCTPPPWLRWGKFASYFTYGLNALITLEFQNAEPIKCGSASMVPVCNMTIPETNQTVTHFPSKFVLIAQNITWSVFDDVIVIIVIGLIARILWYIVLRRK